MKAVFISEFGGVDKLIYGDRPDLTASPGEVVLQVRASALNHLDLGVRSGRGRVPGDLPRILGCDMAGEIAQIGPGVMGFGLGGLAQAAGGLLAPIVAHTVYDAVAISYIRWAPEMEA